MLPREDNEEVKTQLAQQEQRTVGALGRLTKEAFPAVFAKEKAVDYNSNKSLLELAQL